VDAAEGALFDYLSQVGNLPHYFARMTSAEPGNGHEVHTTAQLPDGQQVEGDAWFRVDERARRIEWGSEGPNDYHGSLEISEIGGGAEVAMRMHTTRVPDGSSELQQGLDTTLATIKRLVEQQKAGGRARSPEKIMSPEEQSPHQLQDADHPDDTDHPDDAGERPDIFPTIYRSAHDAADAAALAEAERAVARHGATPEQVDGVTEAAQVRRAEERLEGWRRRE
jgi:hypothetical protein